MHFPREVDVEDFCTSPGPDRFTEHRDSVVRPVVDGVHDRDENVKRRKPKNVLTEGREARELGVTLDFRLAEVSEGLGATVVFSKHKLGASISLNDQHKIGLRHRDAVDPVRKRTIECGEPEEPLPKGRAKAYAKPVHIPLVHEKRRSPSSRKRDLVAPAARQDQVGESLPRLS
jgi:hypothetical protein